MYDLGIYKGKLWDWKCLQSLLCSLHMMLNSDNIASIELHFIPITKLQFWGIIQCNSFIFSSTKTTTTTKTTNQKKIWYIMEI